MNCLDCGHGNPERAKFCLECGTALRLRCTQCQTELPAAARFCLECGTPVAAGANASEAAATAAERSPVDYTPKHLADKILQNRSALEGERKQVTVLFADVKGSMELASQLDPELWHGILDGFFNLLADGVHRFEGTVNQYTGDGIMALFGAPIGHEDHAQRALYAALYLLEGVRRHALEVRREHGLDISFRMGLNSGEVVVGKIGDDLRMDYTAAGHSVGLAQRMESLAEAGACYLSDATAALVEGYFELEDLGEFSIKGVGDGVRVHKLLGTGAARTRFDVSRQRGLSRFVGRADDVATLESALDRARAGHGAVVAVIAEAGTGKSRLCFEFVEQCRAAGYAVVEGHAVAHGKTLPLVPVYEIFRGYFGIDDSDDPRSAREKVAGRLLLLDDSFRDVLPTLFEFLGVGDPEQPAPNMDPDARQRHLFGVVRGLLELSTAERPGLLLVEDLHWLDGASETWVREWVDAVAGTHNLLLLNSRPEYRADWMQRSHYQQLALAPLGPEAIHELIEALLGSHASTAGLADAIYRRTRGNPFFAEEVVRTLIESGELEGAPRAYELKRPVEHLRVPDSVQSLLAARIDRLPQDAKRLLQTAAVIGKEFREPVLAKIAGFAPQELRETLAQLRDAEFLYEASLYPVAEYAFKHPLTQEVALGSQLQDTRRRTHAAAAQAIEEFDAERLDEQAAAVALPWKEAGDSGRAAHWCARAARWAMRTDTEEAYRHWNYVRELASDPTAGDMGELLGQAYVELVNLGWRSGAPTEETHALFEAGRRLLTESGDKRSLALLYSNFTLVGGIHSDETVACYRKAVQLAQELGDLHLEIAVGTATFPGLYNGLLRESLEWADHYLALVEANPGAGIALLHFDPERWIYSARAWSRLLLGDVAGAIEDSNRGLELARKGDAFDLLIAEHMRVSVDLWRGEPASALEHARRQFDLSGKVGGSGNQYLSLSGLGLALNAQGEWREALPFLEEAHALHLESPTYAPYPGLALAHLHCGKPERALEIARDDVAYCARFGIRFSELNIQTDLARVALACGLESDSRAAAARARELAEECEFRILVPAIAEVEAAIEAEFGDAAVVDRLLLEARAQYQEMGATGHAQRLTAEIGDKVGD